MTQRLSFTASRSATIPLLGNIVGSRNACDGIKVPEHQAGQQPPGILCSQKTCPLHNASPLPVCSVGTRTKSRAGGDLWRFVRKRAGNHAIAMHDVLGRGARVVRHNETTVGYWDTLELRCRHAGRTLAGT